MFGNIEYKGKDPTISVGPDVFNWVFKYFCYFFCSAKVYFFAVDNPTDVTLVHLEEFAKFFLCYAFFFYYLFDPIIHIHHLRHIFHIVEEKSFLSRNKARQNFIIGVGLKP